jgi:hypothetical protein
MATPNGSAPEVVRFNDSKTAAGTILTEMPRTERERRAAQFAGEKLGGKMWKAIDGVTAARAIKHRTSMVGACADPVATSKMVVFWAQLLSPRGHGRIWLVGRSRLRRRVS